MRYSRRLLAVLASCALLFLSGTAGAQETMKSKETRNFEVISVDGNKVVYKSEAGVREVTLPDDFKLTVEGGQQVTVRDLKPGMKGTAVITTTTTTTPVTVTEVRNATVLAKAGNAIIVRGQNGVRKFTVEDVNDRNIMIMKDGQRVDLMGLREGDVLTATIITRHPPKVMTEREVQASLQAPPAAPAPAPAAEAPPAAPAPEPAPAPMAKKLPKTASDWPLVSLLGALFLATGVLLAVRRRHLERSL
jgi:LPXTG-motif cell wall-anchored protein